MRVTADRRGATRAHELYEMGARSLDDLRTGRYGLTHGQEVKFISFLLINLDWSPSISRLAAKVSWRPDLA